MTIRPLFAWYDMWIGAYFDRERGMLYLLPIPCFGIVVRFRQRALPSEQTETPR